MDIEWLRKYCLSLPGTSEDIKWGNDLCFLVAGKMFCVAGKPTSIKQLQKGRWVSIHMDPDRYIANPLK